MQSSNYKGQGSHKSLSTGLVARAWRGEACATSHTCTHYRPDLHLPQHSCRVGVNLAPCMAWSADLYPAYHTLYWLDHTCHIETLGILVLYQVSRHLLNSHPKAGPSCSGKTNKCTINVHINHLPCPWDIADCFLPFHLHGSSTLTTMWARPFKVLGIRCFQVSSMCRGVATTGASRADAPPLHNYIKF